MLMPLTTQERLNLQKIIPWAQKLRIGDAGAESKLWILAATTERLLRLYDQACGGIMLKSCTLCRHARRQQIGPHEWRHQCFLGQMDFPIADHCTQFSPPPMTTDPPAGLGWAANHED